eukprot:COSAG05_NODE_137_length_16843_cov_121.090779_3_plen_111_part_00
MRSHSTACKVYDAIARCCWLTCLHVQIGCILLSGLFFYDVFWVFLSKPLIGSNVMVTVAKSFKGPIKFLFKKPSALHGNHLWRWALVLWELCLLACHHWFCNRVRLKVCW